MPIYEFYCGRCHTIFNFFSSRVNTSAHPICPRCGKQELTRQISLFAVTGKAGKSGQADDLPVDGAKMEQAMNALVCEADRMNKDDPRQAVDLMRRMSEITGLKMGQGMEEALRRMERGDDPDQIEAEMGDFLKAEDPFAPDAKKTRSISEPMRQPDRDETLYEL
jgi:putative FmdB family regulatory protein